ncbi:DUF1772 domain-containing protein [Bdellovibrio sp. 22V]|uniref:DUF1772 domain-containing protein n=1 Tax=Bdellovibrio TaxID=958 RepID=UPI002543E279|nr:DUF1772 domain-containing protein [Bdellovibrio sp. 22V]WII72586.1 DUF1772 domain-containing protein [Bdellovibrio sp. 22V]
MNVSTLLKYASLLLVGLMAGHSIIAIIDIEGSPLISDLALHMNYPTWAPMAYLSLALLLGLCMYCLRQEWRTSEFRLVGFALLCVLDEAIMSWISDWQMLTPPAHWIDIQSEWVRLLYIRSALLLTAFGLLLASRIVTKKNPVSHQDAFVVA